MSYDRKYHMGGVVGPYLGEATTWGGIDGWSIKKCPLGVLGVGDGITDDVLEEHLQDQSN